MPSILPSRQLACRSDYRFSSVAPSSAYAQLCESTLRIKPHQQNRSNNCCAEVIAQRSGISFEVGGGAGSAVALHLS